MNINTKIEVDKASPSYLEGLADSVDSLAFASELSAAIGQALRAAANKIEQQATTIINQERRLLTKTLSTSGTAPSLITDAA